MRARLRSRSSEVGWSSATVIGSLAAAAVLLAIFLVAELRQRDPMFDMHLTGVPTFDGGLVAAWAISASLFSLLTYLVLWIQDVLGLSAIASGLRFLPLSGALFVAATLAGRLTSVVPIRYLISAGFVLIGTGLWLMRGLTASSGWSHLLAGMIVSGIGAGLVNVPLAATAVGVVESERAGMASGINSTLRRPGHGLRLAAPRRRRVASQWHSPERAGPSDRHRGEQRTGLVRPWRHCRRRCAGRPALRRGAASSLA